jgi:probable F420-dependent oxidoreductase
MDGTRRPKTRSTRIDRGSIGITLDIAPDDAHLDDAVALEHLGYSTIWLAGGQLDSLDRIATIVRATTTIAVGSAIIPPDVYSADDVAKLYADLQATDPDRFVAGLGGSQQPHSLPALEEYLDRLDRADPPVPVERRVLAALGPRKLELAGRRFAGAIILLVTPDYTKSARAILGEASTLVVDQLVVLDTDAARARETARAPLRFLSTVGGYIANFTRMGFSDADVAGLSDHLVDELVAWGDADAIAARVNAQFEAGADQVVLGVLADGDQPGSVEVGRRLAERLRLTPA